jgi:hypothetical protein
MRSLPEPIALQIWEDVVTSMSQYTNDNIAPKFLPPEEILTYIRPVAAVFAQLHFTPLPPLKKIYKSHLYALFYLSIICGIQMYVKERALLKGYVPFNFQTDRVFIRGAKNTVTNQLTEGIKVTPPINQTMDIFLAHLLTSKRLEHLPIKNLEFDSTKFDRFMPVTLLWGYLFAREIIINIDVKQ